MMIKKISQKMTSSNTSPIHLLALVVVSALYGVSLVYAFCGVGILLLLLFIGDLDVKNAQLLALGILLFLPLRYLKKHLEK